MSYYELFYIAFCIAAVLYILLYELPRMIETDRRIFYRRRNNSRCR